MTTQSSSAANGILPAGQLLQFSGSRRLPMIHQSEAAECGIACVAMIAGYHGYEIDLSRLRQRFSVSQHGVNLKQLIDMAAGLHLAGRALQLELDELPQLQTPCVLHWDMNHFVVLKKCTAQKVVIHDPGAGERTLSMEEASKHFTGIALELAPTEQFKPEKARPRLRLRQFWQRIVGLKRSLAIILLLSLLLQLFAIAAPFYMQTVVDDVLLRHDTNLLLVLAIGFGLLMLIRVATEAVREISILHLSTRLNIQMAANLFRHLVRLPMDYFQKRHMGDVVSRFGSLQNIRELLTTGLVSALVDGVMALITLVVMLIYSVQLALVVVGFVVLYGLSRWLLYRPLRRRSEESIVSHARQDSNFMETVRAMQTIKLFQRENDRQNLWQNRYAEAMNADIRVEKLRIGYGVINGLLFGLENIIVVYLAARAVMGDVFSVGMLFAFISYKQRFVDSMDGLIDQLIEMRMIGLHLDRLADITFTQAENVDAALPALPGEQRTGIAGALSVRGLSYQYSDADPPVLAGIDLDIEPGEAVAIVGPSGCGKTTLLKCLMGLMSPSAGEITVDGQPIHQVPDYRASIAAVMQDEQLLSGSIADNIACFDPQPDLNRVQEAAQLAAIHEDILKMPMQYNTLVGDMGTSLSGGQKQRVVLARALYRQPRILFMDEATSHLDAANEQQVNENIRHLNMTRIIVAHRQETIDSADRVVELGSQDQG
ncbi:MAG: peptidase domain-containing ABC transporter [Natronospirillum sp.]|uniref:peptidase domain-containing ABC transporter n=1 Tax=Natronospirillum sp. TaxID=2812955 RepID=UPI0025CC20AE|nr:peptidase domain-containing ABC transporter [Natronospirillum sp.]MCH8551675.1 peptidase domain-containing ABC transporter [Natronospirillum sp.]